MCVKHANEGLVAWRKMCLATSTPRPIECVGHQVRQLHPSVVLRTNEVDRVNDVLHSTPSYDTHPVRLEACHQPDGVRLMFGRLVRDQQRPAPQWIRLTADESVQSFHEELQGKEMRRGRLAATGPESRFVD